MTLKTHGDTLRMIFFKLDYLKALIGCLGLFGLKLMAILGSLRGLYVLLVLSGQIWIL
jgi:hypothetical protein